MRLLLLLFVFCVTLLAQAVPPKPGFKYFTQPDGKVIRLVIHSNEHEKFYTTDDGKVVQSIYDKGVYYVNIQNGKIVVTDVLAHNPNERSTDEKEFVKKLKVSLDEVFACFDSPSFFKPDFEHRKIKLRMGNDGNGMNQYGNAGQGYVNSIGKHRIPVIMAEFSDLSFLPTTTKEKLTRQLNEKGYHDEPECVGSVKDFFHEQSGGLYDPTFDVVARVRVSKKRNYYGENSPTTGHDRNILEFVKEAIDSAARQGVDFSQYIEDKNKKEIPLVAIIFAGQGEADSPDGKESQNYIWPHQSPAISKWYSRYQIEGTNISVNCYFVGNAEKKVASGDGHLKKVTAGMNIFVHEFGHTLGLPDFYATGAKAHRGPTMGYRSHMDIGCYANEGYTPMTYTAYERAYLGWTRLRNLGLTKGEYHIFPYGSDSIHKQTYVVFCPGHPNEYYLLEYRVANKYYPKEMGEGLFVLHVDYDKDIWSRNIVNNEEKNLRMEYKPADNEMQNWPFYNDFTGFPGDLYPGPTGRTDLVLRFRNSPKYIAIHNIEVKGDHIAFQFMQRKKVVDGVQEPTVTEAPEILGIYSLDGRKVSNGINRKLSPGIYIIKTTKGNQKIKI